MDKKILAIIFDMDGTLVDSGLNFDLMRKEIGIPQGEPILEYLATLQDQDFIKRAHRVIHRHELEGVLQSKLFRDAGAFLDFLEDKKIPRGLLTRNSKNITDKTMRKLGLRFDCILTRDCIKAKPDPAGLHHCAEKFQIPVENILYIGDHEFDLDTAINAEAIAGLILHDYNQQLRNKANIVIENFKELIPYF